MTINDSEGRGGLRDHLPPHRAPAQLHDRVRGTLASRGGDSSRRRWPVLAAAAVIVFAAGILTGRVATSRGTPAPTAKYALLLYGGTETAAEAASGSRAQEYGRWAAGLTAARFVGGEELSDVIGEYSAQTSQPETRAEQVAGFFLIDAPDDATAIAVAKDCPHLRYGGRVVLQKLPRAG